MLKELLPCMYFKIRLCFIHVGSLLIQTTNIFYICLSVRNVCRGGYILYSHLNKHFLLTDIHSSQPTHLLKVCAKTKIDVETISEKKAASSI